MVGIAGFEPARDIAAHLESAMSANSIRSPEVCRMDDNHGQTLEIRIELSIPAAIVPADRVWAWVCRTKMNMPVAVASP